MMGTDAAVDSNFSACFAEPLDYLLDIFTSYIIVGIFLTSFFSFVWQKIEA